MKNNTTKFILFIVGLIIVVVALGFVASKKTIAPGKYDAFAQCMKDSGAKFYGAFWCPHCQAQEEALAMSRQRLEDIGLYTECSKPDKTQTQICIDNKIEGYPTWIFKDGSRLSGEIPLDTLAQKTSCVLPK